MTAKKQVIELDRVVIKFAGDSGDGMQLTGSQFTETSALLGNDIATFPDFPAEIRAPQGTVAGVSGFQLHFGNIKLHTPGDEADVLVAMNPAALKAQMSWVKKNGTIIVDLDSFTKRDIEKAGFDENPLENDLLANYNVIEAPITSLTKEELKESGLDNKSIVRCKNMFALGIVYWMFNRPMKQTENFLKAKFKKKPVVVEANLKVLHAGYHYADTIELFSVSYQVSAADLAKGKYRNIMGNQATAWGFLAAAEKANLELFLGSYPITPASDVLHELSKHKHFGVKVFQAEDEIAGICTALGASYGGALGLTSTSGPGLALKGEAIGLAISTELPLVILNVQRGGPSTGLPTKTEQSDLMQALYGRNGESPAVVIAASSPGNCFDYAYMAAKIALEHMTPVILLTDGYLGNGAEPWRIKKMSELPTITPRIAQGENESWFPYQRDENTLARDWAIPGTKGLAHRIGGLEKDSLTGNVSYDPENHEKMSLTRAEKVARVAELIPELEVSGAQEGDLLVVGWGGTFGSLYTAVEHLHVSGKQVGLAHFNYMNPLPKNVKEVFSKYDKIIVCELNLGQFTNYLRGQHPEFSYEQYNKIQGLPFTVQELKDEFNKLING